MDLRNNLTRRQFARFGALASAVCAGGALSGCSGLFSDASSAAKTQEVTTNSKGAASEDAGADATQATATEALTTTFFAFDTVITINAYCSQEVLDDLQERCMFFENHFSRTVEGSDIWNVNHAGGAAVTVAAETAQCVARALEYARLTDGLFDITIGTVSHLWDFVEGIRPADSAVAAALPHVGWQNVQVDTDAQTIQLTDPETMLDLGGIAKGFIADDLSARLSAAGCQSAVINLGGNVAVVGAKPDGSAWNVGIQDPNSDATSVVAAIKCTSASVVTSGLYERNFTLDGVNYYHILDPRTGYPVATDLASSSVLCENSVDGDALATTFFLMGRAAAYEWLEANGTYQALLVDDAGDIAQTSNSTFELV